MGMNINGPYLLSSAYSVPIHLNVSRTACRKLYLSSDQNLRVKFFRYLWGYFSDVSVNKRKTGVEHNVFPIVIIREMVSRKVIEENFI